jgi:hypothetical protein
MKYFKFVLVLVSILLVGSMFFVSAAGDLTAGEARKVIARMAGIQMPSDAVRVKSVSSLGSSAIVEAQIQTAFKLEKGDDGNWRVAEIRTGDRTWENVDLIVKALNREKSKLAHSELETIATALESFRRERGFYVEAKTESALFDHLNPKYISRVIRLDPWSRPYQYEGTSAGFTLSSLGEDGKRNTSDDVVLSNSTRP